LNYCFQHVITKNAVNNILDRHFHVHTNRTQMYMIPDLMGILDTREIWWKSPSSATLNDGSILYQTEKLKHQS